MRDSPPPASHSTCVGWGLCGAGLSEPTGWNRQPALCFSKRASSLASLVLCVDCIIGELWKQRNKKVFKNGRVDYIEVFTMVQLQVWSWITSKVRLTCFSYSGWCLKHLLCMRTVKKGNVRGARLGWEGFLNVWGGVFILFLGMG